MKKQYDASRKARSAKGFCKHLRPYGKRMANKSSRRNAKQMTDTR